MKCLECGSTMKKHKENYKYAESGLNNFVLVDTEVYRCGNCGEEEAVIKDIEKLHDFMATYIASKEHKLSGEEVRFLRSHMGYSGVQFAKKVGVKPETVSRWENNKQAIDVPAERLIRVLVLSGAEPSRNYDDLENFGIKDILKRPQKVYLKPSRQMWKQTTNQLKYA